MPLATLQESNRNSFSLSFLFKMASIIISSHPTSTSQSAFRMGRANNKRPKAMPPQCLLKVGQICRKSKAIETLKIQVWWWTSTFHVGAIFSKTSRESSEKKERVYVQWFSPSFTKSKVLMHSQKQNWNRSSNVSHILSVINLVIHVNWKQGNVGATEDFLFNCSLEIHITNIINSATSDFQVQNFGAKKKYNSIWRFPKASTGGLWKHLPSDFFSKCQGSRLFGMDGEDGKIT